MFNVIVFSKIIEKLHGFNYDEVLFLIKHISGETGKDMLLKHLLVEHNFVIGDVHLVANLPEYIR